MIYNMINVYFLYLVFCKNLFDNEVEKTNKRANKK